MEHRKRCKVCGKIWCFTDDDLRSDNTNNVLGAITALGGIASAFGGNIFQQQYFADRMENNERKSVNRNQCPNCHSLDIEDITAEEFEKYSAHNTLGASVKATVTINSNATPDSLLRRTKLLLEDKDWSSANAYCESVLDVEPENATAYLYKLMVDLKVSTQEELKNNPVPFEGNGNYKKALRFGDEELKSTLTGYIEHINNRIENERLEGIYAGAKELMGLWEDEFELKEAARIFESIVGYKDASDLAKKCYEKAEALRKDDIYYRAKSQMTGEYVSSYSGAINLFESISGWKDSAEQICACQNKIEEIKAEEKRRSKHNKMLTLIIMAIICLLAVWLVVISPMLQYNEAQEQFTQGDIDAAISSFEKLGDYKDSASRLQEAKYIKAEDLFADRDFDAAIALFSEIADYSDSAIRVNEVKYAKAEGLFADRDFDAAIRLFNEIADYSDSAIRLNEVKYAKAEKLFAAEDYVAAEGLFRELGHYKDSSTRRYTVMYEYVVNNLELDSETRWTKESYLKELISIGYEDSASLYEEINTWKATLTCANEIVFDHVTISDSVSPNPSYFHFEFAITGGPVNESATFTHTVYWPDGTAMPADWTWDKVTYGESINAKWSNGFTTEPGTLTVEVYHEGTGELVGSFSIEVT